MINSLLISKTNWMIRPAGLLFICIIKYFLIASLLGILIWNYKRWSCFDYKEVIADLIIKQFYNCLLFLSIFLDFFLQKFYFMFAYFMLPCKVREWSSEWTWITAWFLFDFISRYFTFTSRCLYRVHSLLRSYWVITRSNNIF